eukprot:Lankesteria_metandrocarpae@DN2927_c1_g1_i1.p1
MKIQIGVAALVALLFDYGECFYAIDPFGRRGMYNCIMQTDTGYTFVPTIRSHDGHAVYQAYDTSCVSMDLYMLYIKANKGWFMNDAPHVKYSCQVGGACPNHDFGQLAKNICEEGVINGNRYGVGTKIKMISKSPCDPVQAVPFPIDRSGTYCVLSNKEYNTLLEIYTFIPTMLKRNGKAVYQGYDNATCLPLNRYLYAHDSYDSKREWKLDNDLDIHNGTLGYVWGYINTCVEASWYDIYRDIDKNKYNLGHYIVSYLKKKDESRCIIRLQQSSFLLDKASSCVFSLTGGENYTFLPTTTVVEGETVYQGYDSNTCQPLSRYIYRQKLNGVEGYEWNLDSNLQHEGSRHASIPDFRGCTESAAVTYKGWDTYAELKKIESSICFRPVKAKALTLDESKECVLSVTG